MFWGMPANHFWVTLSYRLCRRQIRQSSSIYNKSSISDVRNTSETGSADMLKNVHHSAPVTLQVVKEGPFSRSNKEISPKWNYRRTSLNRWFPNNLLSLQRTYLRVQEELCTKCYVSEPRTYIYFRVKQSVVSFGRSWEVSQEFGLFLKKKSRSWTAKRSFFKRRLRWKMLIMEIWR